MTDSFETEFTGSASCGEGVASFRFRKPAGYTFIPGQFFSLTLELEGGPTSKYFSHADAPGDPIIELTTRLTGSEFKNALLALEPGQTVSLDGPKGRLRVPEGAASVGFLAGGVGITPAHSIIRDAVLRPRPIEMYLFYGNRDEGCVPYGDEFRRYAEGSDWFTYVETLDNPGPTWKGETGFISAEMILSRVRQPLDTHWIVAGPPPMVDAMKLVVSDLRLPPESVSYELFSGYAPKG